MLSIIANESNPVKKESVVPTLNLRAFRNKFFKYYIQSERDFSAEDLSALLLYFALSFIENRRGLAKLFSTAASLNKRFDEFADNEMLTLGGELLELLDEFLPINLRGVMTVPNKVSWYKAKQFFVEQNAGAFFNDIANLGFAYQIFSLSGRKEKALPALQKANKKISKEELIAFTQLYTPNWVVDFLVANTILLGKERGGISNKYCCWLIPEPNPSGKKGNVQLESFSLLDPACGAGQFIFSAFDLLMELYRQNGYEETVAAKLILRDNIFGADIDEKALWVAGLGLLSKYLVISDSINSMPNMSNNLALINETEIRGAEINQSITGNNFLGSIDDRLPENHFLKNQYSVLLTNPPYIGRRCLSRELKALLKEQYPNSSADLSAAFLERCLTMLKPDGKLGIITQSSVMSIPSYKALRGFLLNNFYTQAAIHCGPGVFPLASGEKIDSILLLVNGSDILKQEKGQSKTYFVDLSTEKDKAIKLKSVLNRALNMNDYNESNYGAAGFVHQSNFAHGIPNNLLSQLSPNFYIKINKLPKLGDIAEIRQGLATTDNGRFVRYHFDVEDNLIGKTWVPYVKGAGGERYASNNPFVVKWGKNGNEIKEAVDRAYPYLKGKTAWVVKNEEFYFRAGLCFSFINKSGLAVRRLSAGAIFDVASSAIFASPDDEDFLLAYLNSRIIGLLAKSINQTINIQVGDLKKIPIIPLTDNLKDEISKLGNLAFAIKNDLLNCALPLIKLQSIRRSANDLSIILEEYIKLQKQLTEKLSCVQSQIDNKVMDALEIGRFIDPTEKQILGSNIAVSDPKELNEKQYVYKMLNSMVSNTMSTDKEDKLILVPDVNKESLAKLFNLTGDGIDWFEDKLGISLEKIFSQARITDISKLAQEPSRYFSCYLKDDNSCMFFSSRAARHFGRDMSDIFITQELSTSLDLLKKVTMLWESVFVKLDTIVDWTSRDLLLIFESSEFN